MSDLKSTAKLALEALEHGLDYAKSEQFENAQRYKGYESLAPDDAHSIQLIEAAITSLRQAIAEAEKQEPVAECVDDGEGGVYYKTLAPKAVIGNLYTHPQPKADHIPDATKMVEQEPVAWMDRHFTCDLYKNKPELDVVPLYTHPQPTQEQGEPVAWVNLEEWMSNNGWPDDCFSHLPFEHLTPLYTTPQQRKPLTLEQLRKHWQVARVLDMTDAEIDFADYVLIARDVEALYGIKE